MIIFILALEESTNEFWIVFRKKLYIFDDFLKSWHKQLSETEDSPLVTRILHEIHKYQVEFWLNKYNHLYIVHFRVLHHY